MVRTEVSLHFCFLVDSAVAVAALEWPSAKHSLSVHRAVFVFGPARQLAARIRLLSPKNALHLSRRRRRVPVH